MTSSDMVRSALASVKKTQRSLATHMGWSPQNLSIRLKMDTLTFDEMVKCLAFCGYTVEVKNPAGRDLPSLEESRDKSPRVRQTVDGKVYDTQRAESICTNRGGPGNEHQYLELFRAEDGEYFCVFYQRWEGGGNSVQPVSLISAKKFWAKYSGIPSKEPKESVVGSQKNLKNI